MTRELPLSEWEGWEERAGTLTTQRAAVYDFPHTADIREFDGMKLKINEDAAPPAPLWLTVTLIPLASGRPEFIKETKAHICLPPYCRAAYVPYSAFDSGELVGAYRKYISKIRLELKAEDNNEAELVISRIALEKEGDFQAEAPAASQTGDIGERLEWKVRLENDTELPRFITVTEKRSGRESISLEYPTLVKLSPKETKELTVSACLPENIPAGGYEARTLEWIPDGDGSKRRSVTLYASRRIEHPFILHTKKGWERLTESLKTDQTLYQRFESEYQQAAESWEVPRPYQGKEYVYESPSQDMFLKTVVAWKATGKQAYFDKLIQYIEGFLDEENGYLATEFSYFQCVESRDEYAKGTFPVRHAVSAGWVQEGEFMTKLAIAYDLLYDCPQFTEDMHSRMEACMRNYMEFVSWRLTDGDGNNFQLAESSAALYFACLLQDRPMIDRFLSGNNGLYELIGSVLSDDGGYFEGASNYIRLAADILLHITIACENYGLNLKDMRVDASHDKYVIHAPWATPRSMPFLGMSFERALPVQRPVRKLKDFTDNLLSLLTPEGILFSANDSNEQNLVPVMEIAYYLYRDSRYLPILKAHGHNGILYGSHMIPEEDTMSGRKSRLNTGNGYAILRETKNGFIQAVMKYGQHGGYHGHYDRLSLVSLIRDGKTLHNMEFSWYTYSSFLFKMWVQTSLAHNMVAVDRRMQEPSVCQCIYFEDRDDFQAVCAQTVSRWCDPPYGGQTPYLWKFPEEKCEKEGRFILPPKEARRQGDIGEYSEPVFQRRLIVLLEGCCFIWDYEKADHSHSFDCFYHPFGTAKAEGVKEERFTEYLDENPYGAAQFIRSCHWYRSKGTVKLTFENHQKRVNPNDIIDFAEKTQLYGIFPQEGEVMIGRYPHRQDSFAAGENCGHRELLQQPCKKAVAFHQEGTAARFITAIQIGESPIDSISCDSYEKIGIHMRDGSRRELRVTGMDCENTEEISVLLAKK